MAAIIDSTIHSNLNNGIVINPPTGVSNFVSMERVRVVNNLAYGVGVNPGSTLEMKDCVISGNPSSGLLTTGAPVDISNSVISNNGTGIQASSGGVIRIGGSTVTGNTTALNISGGTISSYGDNYFAGVGFGMSSISKQ